MRVHNDDAEIDVEIAGEGDAIVLIHGFPLARDTWDAQAAQLGRAARVVRPDLRGMGRSTVPQGPYLMETLAADIAAVLDAASIVSATIVGHSLGGYVALAFARMYTERVKRLALVCSRLAADSAETARARYVLADRIERENDIEPVVEAYLPRLFSARTLEDRSPVVETARAIARRNDPRGAAAMLRGMAQRVDSFDIAADLLMPVLIVGGACDQIVPAAETEEMRRAFPRAVLRVLPRSGHMPMAEEPAALTDVLKAFACAKN